LPWFETLGDAKVIIEALRRDYNKIRPYMALKGQSPVGFAHASELGARQDGLKKAEN